MSDIIEKIKALPDGVEFELTALSQRRHPDLDVTFYGSELKSLVEQAEKDAAKLKDCRIIGGDVGDR